MIEEKLILALIPARGGSKGLPGKNIIDFAGKPLLAWTVEAAKQSKYIDRIVLSSDDEAIIEVAKKYGCEVPFKRPPELAADATPGIDVVQHALQKLPDYDYLVLLQPTSPLRSTADIDGAISLCVEKNVPAVVSVCAAEKPPEWLYYRDDADHLAPVLDSTEILTCRQNSRPAVQLNGAIYVARTEWLIRQNGFLGEQTLAFEMPRERSIDIDTKLDLEVARATLNI